MKKLFAVPTVGGKLTAHFGHCEKFAIIEVEENKILTNALIEPPVHQPGVYPKFLADMGVSTIIAGGMGQQAQDLFKRNNIEVYLGIDSIEPTILVDKYLSQQLEAGGNLCDH